VRDTLLAADLAVCNLESPPATIGYPIAAKEIWFRAKPEATEAMARAGIDVVSLANNHSLDYGREAFRESLSILDSQGIAYCGGGLDMDGARTPRVVERSGLKVAFLGYSQFADIWWSPEERFTFVAGEDRPGVAPLRLPAGRLDLAGVSAANPHLAGDIARAREAADVVVVSVHWGTEYTNVPDSFQLVAARAMIEAGADLVLEHHPHAVQGLAASGDSLAAFSLGNFVFDQRRSGTDESMILQVEVSTDGVFSWDVVPVRITATQPVPSCGTNDGDEILRLSGQSRL